jgi:hypothetical protein
MYISYYNIYKNYFVESLYVHGFGGIMSGRENSFDSCILGDQDRFTLNSGIENRSFSRMRLEEIVGIPQSWWEGALHPTGVVITTTFHNPCKYMASKNVKGIDLHVSLLTCFMGSVTPCFLCMRNEEKGQT